MAKRSGKTMASTINHRASRSNDTPENRCFMVRLASIDQAGMVDALADSGALPCDICFVGVSPPLKQLDHESTKSPASPNAWRIERISATGERNPSPFCIESHSPSRRRECTGYRRPTEP